ncbi:hypothetical protein AYK21_04680 [Thermoplasmatales archaeon SG8-52-2]|nr:MAG: hypothetical protein AYK21_04680 [Thermoplasmatales archaeon SG8-52-2]
MNVKLKIEMKQSTIFIDSTHWECLPNLVGCSRLYHYFIENGHSITTNPSKADYIIINTCGYHKKYEKKTVDIYQKYYKIKKKSGKIIIYGCFVKINKQILDGLDVFPVEIDEGYKLDKLFYKKIKFERINTICDDETKRILLKDYDTHGFLRKYPFQLTIILFPFSKKLREIYKKIISELTHTNRMFVLISKGCTGKCNYCAIKKAKGNLKSKKIKDILEDIKSIKNPSKTLFLAADDCGCYGADIKSSLIELVYEINKSYPDISIDLNYLNPKMLQDYPKNYIKLFEDISFKYVIIPIQSGSKKIIDNMNRDYDPKKVVKIVDQIKKVSPKTIFYSHFILNYPGEKSLDFFKTILTTFHFDIPLPFIYCPMKGTVSASTKKEEPRPFGILKWFIFMFITNFIILFKIIKYQK